MSVFLEHLSKEETTIQRKPMTVLQKMPYAKALECKLRQKLRPT